VLGLGGKHACECVAVALDAVDCYGRSPLSLWSAVATYLACCSAFDEVVDVVAAQATGVGAVVAIAVFDGMLPNMSVLVRWLLGDLTH
jgi:hypothetical protein